MLNAASGTFIFIAEVFQTITDFNKKYLALNGVLKILSVNAVLTLVGVTNN